MMVSQIAREYLQMLACTGQVTSWRAEGYRCTVCYFRRGGEGENVKT